MPRLVGSLGIALVLLAFYLVTLGWRGVLLLGTGSAVGIALGAAVLVIGVIGVWVIAAELLFGVRTHRLARALAAEGGLPVDDLPRHPSGRIDRTAAATVFETYAQRTREHPQDWREWFRLALAYDAAGDRTRARAAARAAVRLGRSG